MENVNDILLSKKSRLHYRMYSMIHSFKIFLIRTQTKSLINVIFFLLLASKESIIWNNVTKKRNRKTVIHQMCSCDFLSH